MPLLIRHVVDTDGVEWVVRKLIRESAGLGQGVRLRCYAVRRSADGLKLDAQIEDAWEKLSDAELIRLLARAIAGRELNR